MSLPEAKVEHHEGRGVRSWPLFPVLRTILEQLLEELTIDGRYPSPESFVVNKPEYRAAAMRPGGWANANLRTQFLKILRKAGVAPWARLFHSTRASRQTELEAQFPLHVVCSWLGNSESVATDSYLLVTDSHFQAATTPIRGTPALRLDETPDEKTGNSCATGVQQIAARNGTQENETNENTGENEKSQVSLAFFKWRRGELNPRPAILPIRPLHV